MTAFSVEALSLTSLVFVSGQPPERYSKPAVNKGSAMYAFKQTRIVSRNYLHAHARRKLLHQAAQEIHKHVSINGRRPTYREAKFLAGKWIEGRRGLSKANGIG